MTKSRPARRHYGAAPPAAAPAPAALRGPRPAPERGELPGLPELRAAAGRPRHSHVAAAPDRGRAHGALEARQPARGHRGGDRHERRVVRVRDATSGRSARPRIRPHLPALRRPRGHGAGAARVPAPQRLGGRGCHRREAGRPHGRSPWRPRRGWWCPWCATPTASRWRAWPRRWRTSPRGRARSGFRPTSSRAGPSRSRIPVATGTSTASPSSTSPRSASCAWARS